MCLGVWSHVVVSLMHFATGASYAAPGAPYWPGDVCCAVSGVHVLGEAYELLLQ